MVGSRSIFSYLGCIQCGRWEKTASYIQSAGKCLVNLPAPGTCKSGSRGQLMRLCYLGELCTLERDSDTIQDAVGWDLRSVRVDRVEELEFRGKRGLRIREMAVRRSLRCKSP